MAKKDKASAEEKDEKPKDETKKKRSAKEIRSKLYGDKE